MNEIQRRELKGIDGWLVLFQIQIISILAGAAMACVIIPIILAVQNSAFGVGVNVFAIYGDFFIPGYLAYMIIAFGLSLTCMILFYRRKMVFRTVYVVLSGAVIVFMVLYYIFGMSQLYMDMGSIGQFDIAFSIFMRVFTGISILASVAPYVVMSIALFKSYRVKNTFS